MERAGVAPMPSLPEALAEYFKPRAKTSESPFTPTREISSSV
jgi:hypothetical protein